MRLELHKNQVELKSNAESLHGAKFDNDRLREDIESERAKTQLKELQLRERHDLDALNLRLTEENTELRKRLNQVTQESLEFAALGKALAEAQTKIKKNEIEIEKRKQLHAKNVETY